MSVGGAGEVRVRPLRGDDRAAWEPLWQGYLAFYAAVVDEETTDVVFHRLTDPGVVGFDGFVAVADGRVLGFAHVQTHLSTWSVAHDCYLEDLFVDPAARGRGVGRALLASLVEQGREAGWRKVHWLTDTGNDTARRLYDDVGELAGQVRYTIDLT